MEKKKDKSNFFGISATSTNPIIPNFVSASSKLLEKIEYFVIDGSLDDFTLRIYRESSSKPGFLSCDNYKIINMQRTGKVRKDKDKKYGKKPIPKNAVKYNIAGSDIYSINELNRVTIKSLEKIINYIC